MNVDEVLARIDGEAIAADTLEFVRVKSETGVESAGCEFIADLWRREGLEPSVDVVEGDRNNVYTTVEGRGGGPALMFNGHIDTIPIGASDPPARDGEWIVGRGAEDMKGGLVAMTHAAAAIQQAGVRLAGELTLTSIVGHEVPVGKKEGAIRLIQRVRDGDLHADAMIIVEGRRAIWTASLGFVSFTITITSPRGRIHNLYVPYAENPARWAGEVLSRLARWEDDFADGPAHPLAGRTQVNVGIVDAGDYMNRVPTPAVITGTYRWPPGRDWEAGAAAFEALRAEIADRSGLEVTVGYLGLRPPFETSADEPVVRSVTAAARAVTGDDPDVIGMALVGDANLFANQIPVPTVYYGPGHGTAHSDHERIRADDLTECARIYALASIEYCGVAS